MKRMAKARLRSLLFTIAALAPGATLNACSTDEADEATVEQDLSTYHIRWYFSDESMTQQVGEHSLICTSATNWGVRTPWVYSESDSCNAGPGSGWNWDCTCCWDSNGNGSCDGSEWNTWHVCSAQFSCH